MSMLDVKEISVSKDFERPLSWPAAMKGPQPLQSLHTNVTFNPYLAPSQSTLPTTNAHALAVLGEGIHG